MVAGSATKCQNKGSISTRTFISQFTSVHVPQLIRAVDDESFTVKVLRTSAIQSGTFPQTGVVVTSGHLAWRKMNSVWFLLSFYLVRIFKQERVGLELCKHSLHICMK